MLMHAYLNMSVNIHALKPLHMV